MNTYAKGAANPCGMRTYKIIGLKAGLYTSRNFCVKYIIQLKVSCNEHLQKKGEGEDLSLPNGAEYRRDSHVDIGFWP